MSRLHSQLLAGVDELLLKVHDALASSQASFELV